MKSIALATGLAGLGLLLVTASPVEAVGDCEAWPGEHRPLPTVSDSDPYLARWSELRAEELRALADRWALERPAAAATLRAHAACLAPRQGAAKNARTVRITRAGQPFSAPPVGTPAPTESVVAAPVQAERPIDAETVPPVGTRPPIDSETTLPDRNPPAIAQAASPSPVTEAVVSNRVGAHSNAAETSEPFTPVPGTLHAGPAASGVRVLGQRTDQPIERGRERPSGITEPSQAPTATSEPVPELRPSGTPDADSSVAPSPRRKDPRVGRDKPFPPPRKLDPRRLAVEAPATASSPGAPREVASTRVVVEPRASDATAPSEVGTAEATSGGSTPQGATWSSGQAGTRMTVDRNATSVSEPNVGVGTLGERGRPDVAAPPEVPDASSPNDSSPAQLEERRAEDARRAMREAIVAAGARARAELARREQAARRAAPPKPATPPAATTPPIQEPPPQAAAPSNPNEAKDESLVARVDPGPAVPISGPPRPPQAVAEPRAAESPADVSGPPSLSGRTGLDRVRAEVRQARFESALDVAREMRDNLDAPESAPIRAELEVLAATAALALGREDEARQYFGSALAAAPDLELESEDHSPKVRELFETVRAETSP